LIQRARKNGNRDTYVLSIHSSLIREALALEFLEGFPAFQFIPRWYLRTVWHYDDVLFIFQFIPRWYFYSYRVVHSATPAPFNSFLVDTGHSNALYKKAGFVFQFIPRWYATVTTQRTVNIFLNFQFIPRWYLWNFPLLYPIS